MKRKYRTTRSRKGMAMLMVLFIVMAIAIISSGFIARSDITLACGRNYCVRNEVDYATWGGLEVAWALVQDPNTLSTLTFPLTDQLDTASQTYYDLTIGSSVSDVYPVECTAYQQNNGQDRARSTLYGKLYYNSASGAAYYISVTRQ
ncbi:MAG: hypothetical protein ISS71_02160 [Phycisphaerae bacterium]|nr:hypothetical protein [Phycisphaerae bacterium]